MPKKRDVIYRPLEAGRLYIGEIFKISDRNNNKTHYKVIEIDLRKKELKAISDTGKKYVTIKFKTIIWLSPESFNENLKKFYNDKPT